LDGGIFLVQEKDLAQVVREIVNTTPVVDMHTHLFDPALQSLMLRGLDQLLIYHYLIAEALRWTPAQSTGFWSMSPEEQASLIWKTLFLEHSPVSESCRGVLTTLQRFGLDLSTRDLESYRRFFAGLTPEEHVDFVLEKAGISSVVMTNDPFDPVERNYWQAGFTRDQRFKAALRVDPLLNDWPQAAECLRRQGYKAQEDFSGETFGEIHRFLIDWVDRIDPLYLAVSLGPDFIFPDHSPAGRIINRSILPVCREINRPLALMIGVKRQVNPMLRVAGDSVGKAKLNSLEYLAVNNPQNKFLVTLLSRENQHELSVIARKFSNVMIFGCWWFLNNPSLIQEITAMRLELLGLSFVPQHSDARVLDQLIYKWTHSRELIVGVLTEKYRDLLAAGWRLREDEIKRDVKRLFSDNFLEFVQK